MSPLLQREIPGGFAPGRLLRGLPRGLTLHVLESDGPEGWGSPPGGAAPGLSLLAVEPEREFRGGLPALLDALAWLDPKDCRARFERFLVGHLAYDLGRAFERVPELAAPGLPVPDVCLAAYRAVYLYDARLRAGRIVGSDRAAVDRLEERVRTAHVSPGPVRRPSVGTPKPRTDRADYLRAVDTVRDWIGAGDVYQANLSRRLDFAGVPPESHREIYAELARSTPAPFGAFIEAGDHALISNSPERFLRVQRDRVETCPIKGTRPRGASPEEDRWLAKELCSSEKDRAEHLMIVDLERNDLGRVCRTGSVRVARFAGLRSFATVHHLVSSIVGELRDPDDVPGLIAATFPGGSITGAPKIRAMQIIEELEPVRRGVYTGAIGYFDGSGDLDLSIAIRTAVAAGTDLTLHVGGGIVADSDPEAELRETEDKARAFARFWTP